VDGKANSTPEGLPWVEISQTEAILECNKIGAHLITNAEWTALARHIAAQPSNWSSGVVGDGVLSRGYSASTTNASDGFTNTAAAPNTGIGYEYNTGANTVGSSGFFDLKRIHSLANGQTIWDLAGNVYEWNSDTCISGSGEGNWYNSSYIEWTDSNLDDYERLAAGHNSLYNSAQNIGMYRGCTVNGNAMLRSGRWNSGLNSGLFGLFLNNLSSGSSALIGFRCAK
jgi:formylglycine-generating enzyme required for sulfatase activity